MPKIVDLWNAAYFDGRLSPGVLAELRALEDASADAQALADRALRLMRAARLQPTDFSLLTAWMIGFSVPRTVPSAWSGTAAHRKTFPRTNSPDAVPFSPGSWTAMSPVPPPALAPPAV